MSSTYIDNFTSSLPIWVLSFSLWLFCLGLLILCWMKVVRVDILVPFQILVGRLSSFLNWVLYCLWVSYCFLEFSPPSLHCSFSSLTFLMLRSQPKDPFFYKDVYWLSSFIFLKKLSLDYFLLYHITFVIILFICLLTLWSSPLKL